MLSVNDRLNLFPNLNHPKKIRINLVDQLSKLVVVSLLFAMWHAIFNIVHF